MSFFVQKKKKKLATKNVKSHMWLSCVTRLIFIRPALCRKLAKPLVCLGQTAGKEERPEGTTEG